MLVVHRSPPRHPWLDGVADTIERDLGRKLLHELGTLRARPDEAQVPFKDVDGLGNLIQVQTAEYPTHPSHPPVVLRRPLRTVGFRAPRHRAEPDAPARFSTS